MAKNFLAEKDIVIIAYGEVKNELRSGKTATELTADVMVQLLAKTGLTNREIDGFALTLPLPETLGAASKTGISPGVLPR